MDRYDKTRRHHDALPPRIDRLYVIASCRHGMLPQGRLRELLVRELQSLRSLLYGYFAHEETDGYLLEVTRSRPSLHLRVADLMSQHGELLRRCDELFTRFAQGDDLEQLKAELRRILDDLELHEQTEVAMLEAAPLDDVAPALSDEMAEAG